MKKSKNKKFASFLLATATLLGGKSAPNILAKDKYGTTLGGKSAPNTLAKDKYGPAYWAACGGLGILAAAGTIAGIIYGENKKAQEEQNRKKEIQKSKEEREKEEKGKKEICERLARECSMPYDEFVNKYSSTIKHAKLGDLENEIKSKIEFEKFEKKEQERKEKERREREEIEEKERREREGHNEKVCKEFAERNGVPWEIAKEKLSEIIKGNRLLDNIYHDICHDNYNKLSQALDDEIKEVERKKKFDNYMKKVKEFNDQNLIQIVNFLNQSIDELEKYAIGSYYRDNGFIPNKKDMKGLYLISSYKNEIEGFDNKVNFKKIFYGEAKNLFKIYFDDHVVNLKFLDNKLEFKYDSLSDLSTIFKLPDSIKLSPVENPADFPKLK